MKILSLYLIGAIAMTSVATTAKSQSSAPMRGEWQLDRGTPGERVSDYPAHDIYTNAQHYSSGSGGVKRDIKKAFELYVEAAEAGHPLAQCRVGACYYYGSGTGKDKKKAFKYWEMSANAGIAEAQYELGRMHYYGEECKRNYDTAIALFTQSSEAGTAGAYYMLGVCYLKGTGVEKDKVKATEYFNLAAQRGSREARQELENLK